MLSDYGFGDTSRIFGNTQLVENPWWEQGLTKAGNVLADPRVQVMLYNLSTQIDPSRKDANQAGQALAQGQIMANNAKKAYGEMLNRLDNPGSPIKSITQKNPDGSSTKYEADISMTQQLAQAQGGNVGFNQQQTAANLPLQPGATGYDPRQEQAAGGYAQDQVLGTPTQAMMDQYASPQAAAAFRNQSAAQALAPQQGGYPIPDNVASLFNYGGVDNSQYPLLMALRTLAADSGGLTPEQFAVAQRQLGETWGSMFNNQLNDAQTQKILQAGAMTSEMGLVPYTVSDGRTVLVPPTEAVQADTYNRYSKSLMDQARIGLINEQIRASQSRAQTEEDKRRQERFWKSYDDMFLPSRMNAEERALYDSKDPDKMEQARRSAATREAMASPSKLDQGSTTMEGPPAGAKFLYKNKSGKSVYELPNGQKIVEE